MNRSLIDNHANHKRPHPTKTSHRQHVTVLSTECKCKHNARGVSSERNRPEDGVKQGNEALSVLIDFNMQ